ncbi:helix-turn-helix domain-containing protein [Haloferula sp. BvORR071]|uniref:helix-turn-helix domain-containing protein n=1 Tax=Haloferula sp. BvORR071 TaxID=1396141 RepID=UPI002240F00D|nr:helix-turn-helix domain-containing protein [Haloferula sp. BvORR071]
MTANNMNATAKTEANGDSKATPTPPPEGYLKGTGIPATLLDPQAPADWIRPKEVAARYGIGRTRLYAMIAEGQIKSVSLRSKEQPHGTRLICRASLIAHLETLWEKSRGDSNEKNESQEGGVA